MGSRLAVVGLSLALGAATLAGCSASEDSSDAGTPSASSAEQSAPSGQATAPQTGPPLPAPTPRVSGTVTTGLKAPWGLALVPDGDAFVSERDTGLVKRVGRDGTVTSLGRVPEVVPRGEGGLMGLAVSPSFDKDRLLYAFHTAAQENRIVRMTVDGDRLGPPKLVLGGIAKASIHNGGRLLFGPDGMLYAGTGDASVRDAAQDRNSLNGKILRMTPDGEPAPGNPFGTRLFSLGHRNPQGLAFDADGRLWASEFGQNTWDELNLIRPGKNYGWPVAEGKAEQAEFVDPVAQWSTGEASPSGIAVAGNAVYMAALRGARLWQIPLDGEKAGRPRAFFVREFGRLRTVARAADDTLWLTTSNTDNRGEPRPGDDRILKVSLK
jgi:glucose/arabinose dehydrogenase